jgi:fatty-acid peroxygenase
LGTKGNAYESHSPQGYDFVPHGGGNASVTHRCPGEAVTVALMEEAIRLLTGSMSYEIPDQKSALNLSRMPALPEKGLRMRNVRRAAAGTGR